MWATLKAPVHSDPEACFLFFYLFVYEHNTIGVKLAKILNFSNFHSIAYSSFNFVHNTKNYNQYNMKNDNENFNLFEFISMPACQPKLGHPIYIFKKNEHEKTQIT